MGIVKIDNGCCWVYSDNGCVIRCHSGGHYVDGDINRDGCVVLTTDDGTVYAYDKNGCILFSVCNSKAVSARWSGDNVIVRCQNGKTDVYSSKGSYLRSI